MYSSGMACGAEVASTDWVHVKDCTFDACKATFRLKDVSSLIKYIFVCLSDFIHAKYIQYVIFAE